MAYKSLSHFVKVLEAAGELVRIQTPVSPFLEISEITDRVVKNKGKALLFENTGTGFPLLINMFGTDRRMCMALGIKDYDEPGRRIEDLFRNFSEPRTGFIEKLKILPLLKQMGSWMPQSLSGRGACQEIVLKDPDLSLLPVMTCWPADGGPFITLPMVHSKDPSTGVRNLGMYRMQVLDDKSTGMHWHLHKGSAAHFRKYRELGQKMPVTVTLGGDPVYTYCATAPLPENLDEYLLAGFLRHKKVGLVKCLTNDLEVPADVDFVLEGYVDPSEELVMEGPFGDHTGFYSLADYYPRFHITCITHRKDAIYPSTIVGIPPMEDGRIGKATERIFLVPIKQTVVPELIDIDMPEEGVFHNITLVKINKTFPGQAVKVMHSLWGAGQMMFNKIMVVVDDTVDVHNYHDVARAIAENTELPDDIHYSAGPVDVLDHSSRDFAYGSKIGIDATSKSGTKKDKIIRGCTTEIETIMQLFPEVTAVNHKLTTGKIPFLLMSVKKTEKHTIRNILQKSIDDMLITGVSFVVVFDPDIDLSSVSDVVWLAAGNIDPERDCYLISTAGKTPVMVIDATRKTSETDHFNRKWPNILVMNDSTIEKVDHNWESYHIGKFLPSPSLKYRKLVKNNESFV